MIIFGKTGIVGQEEIGRSLNPEALVGRNGFTGFQTGRPSFDFDKNQSLVALCHNIDFTRFRTIAGNDNPIPAQS